MLATVVLHEEHADFDTQFKVKFLQAVDVLEITLTRLSNYLCTLRMKEICIILGMRMRAATAP